MKDACSITTLTENTCDCDCDYVPPEVKTVKAMKGEYGNWLVQVNDDGIWRGATYEPETQTLQFSY